MKRKQRLERAKVGALWKERKICDLFGLNERERSRVEQSGIDSKLVYFQPTLLHSSPLFLPPPQSEHARYLFVEGFSSQYISVSFLHSYQEPHFVLQSVRDGKVQGSVWEFLREGNGMEQNNNKVMEWNEMYLSGRNE